jgi:hypothetical protein
MQRCKDAKMQRCKEIEKEDEASRRSEIWILWEGKPLKYNAARKIEQLFPSDHGSPSKGVDFAKSKIVGSLEIRC